MMVTATSYGYKTFLHADASSPSAFAPTSSLSTSLSSLIPSFASLQEGLRRAKVDTANLKFPILVVVGEQSSGKSSCLESIIGASILPKGDGTVTKRPIIITLNRSVSPAPTPALSSPASSSWVAYFPSTGESTNDERRVEKVLADAQKDFTNDPFEVRIASHDVVDLVLVDLPGLVSVPRSDQRRDLREVIKGMYAPYASNPNAVLVTVVAGNNDIQTSESLRFVRKYDPQGERTVVVFTKTDLLPVESHESFVDTVARLPKTLGYFTVKCRSRPQVAAGVSMAQARIEEENFFREHVAFGRACGTGFGALVHRLSSVLETSIRRSLASVLDQMRREQRSLEEELRRLSLQSGHGQVTDVDVNDARAMGRVFLQKYRDFLRAFMSPEKTFALKQRLAEHTYASMMDTAEHLVFETSNSKDGKASSTWWTSVETSSITNSNLASVSDSSEVLEAWRGHVRALLQRASSKIAPSTVDLCLQTLRADLASSNSLEDLPHLDRLCKSLTLQYLDTRFGTLVDRLAYLARLEENIYVNTDAIAAQLQKLKVEKAKRLVALKEMRGKFASDSPERKRIDFEIDVCNKIVNVRSVDRFSNLYTMGYVSSVAERLSSNIFNAVCLELLEHLKEDVQDLLTVEIHALTVDERRRLLDERPELAQRRRELWERKKAISQAVEAMEQLAARA
jgi:hypothetical protein